MYNVIEEVIDFLHKVPPFQFLDEETLRSITKEVSMVFYPKGTTIVYQGGPVSEFIQVIKKGGVKVSLGFSEADEVVIDYRGDGDLIGYLSLFDPSKSRANVVAVEDTICYLLRLDIIIELIKTNPAIREFFHKSFLNKFLDKAYKEIHSKSLPYSVGGNIFFTTPIEELAAKKVITASQDISIQEAANIMTTKKISSLVLVNPAGAPVGIVTDRDLRDKVVAKGRGVSDQIKHIMSPPLIRADAKDFGFEALLKMIKHNVHHLLVVKNGELKGIITNHDLMLLQGTSPVALVKDIENQQSIENLVPLSKRVDNIVGLLLKEGVRASNIGKVISEINDRLVRKILEIAEQKFGEAPTPYCWIAFGSEGRKEQTFKTDQDNAIIYSDPDSDKEEGAIKEYFAEFTVYVKEGLMRCGFPPCTANYMASNPRWCQPLNTWKKNFSNWILVPTQEAILNSVIFLDFRPVYGDFNLSELLRDYITYLLREQKVFLGHVANMVIQNMPPLGFFKTFVVEKSGEYKDQLDLKSKGITPIVDIARLFALEKRIRETSTLDRIEALRDKHQIIKEHADELEHAFEFIMLLRIQNQFEQIKERIQPNNFINPDGLSNLERRTIKEAFQIVSKIQDMIIERYKAMIW